MMKLDRLMHELTIVLLYFMFNIPQAVSNSGCRLYHCINYIATDS